MRRLQGGPRAMCVSYVEDEKGGLAVCVYRKMLNYKDFKGLARGLCG